MGDNNLYDKELNLYYESETRIGDTRILIVKPEITKEETGKRLEQLSNAISSIVGYRTGLDVKE
ncbi:hypothetical protein [Pseudobacteroides cellulosolvens]|uniref:Uncharacterized protein n=1 Tax=Pseudobacteroides cellulosolvens ATCC 35603 = DSM 2933 TaxID=398512 RepID=A0A0L6JGP5_9FIRM|nr:hypothetical protein [Pseudobacteroides cellulosolvens]KNY24888.1 hypothetical protein Bccel_0145 [Pseudobacteroides cellulosolvens ATCC 35603 = DSM 2933]